MVSLIWQDEMSRAFSEKYISITRCQMGLIVYRKTYYINSWHTKLNLYFFGE